MKTAKEFMKRSASDDMVWTQASDYMLKKMEEYAKYVLENQPKKPSKKKRLKAAEKKLRRVADALNRLYPGENNRELNFDVEKGWQLKARHDVYAIGSVRFSSVPLIDIRNQMGSQMEDLLL
jgi:hypothetical protein